MTEHRLARRAAILETAREMIAEKGYEAITVRDLASACRVSVPTLYNQFGGKDQLLAAAIEEHFVGDPSQVRIKTTVDGLERIHTVLDFITNQFLEEPAFHRRLLEAFASLDSTSQVQERITVSLAHEIASQLALMTTRDELEEWVEPELLASQITSAFIGSTVIWAHGDIDDDELLSAVRFATGLVLLGVTREPLAEKIRDRLKEAQSNFKQRKNTQLIRKDTTLDRETN